MREDFQLTELCEALDVARSGYYAARTQPAKARARANQQLVETMKRIHAHRHTRSYGSPRMTCELRARGQSCSKNRVARLMRLHGLRARPRLPFRPKTTTPDHGAHPSARWIASLPVGEITAESTLRSRCSSVCMARRASNGRRISSG